MFFSPPSAFRSDCACPYYWDPGLPAWILSPTNSLLCIKRIPWILLWWYSRLWWLKNYKHYDFVNIMLVLVDGWFCLKWSHKRHNLLCGVFIFCVHISIPVCECNIPVFQWCKIKYTEFLSYFISVLVNSACKWVWIMGMGIRSCAFSSVNVNLQQIKFDKKKIKSYNFNSHIYPDSSRWISIMVLDCYLFL